MQNGLGAIKPIWITCGAGVRRFRAVLDAAGISQKSHDFLAFVMNQKQRYVSGCQLLDHPASAVGRAVGKDDPVPWQAEVEAFWQAQGFDRVVVPSEWRFERREDLEAVVRLEFGDAAERLLAEHAGTRVDYHYCLYWKRYGSPLFQGAT